MQCTDDFQARSSDELSLARGEKVELVERDDDFGDGWYLGKHLTNGNTGLFPEGIFTLRSLRFKTVANKSLNSLHETCAARPSRHNICTLVSSEKPADYPLYIAIGTANPRSGHEEIGAGAGSGQAEQYYETY
jgi:hypothetical protein